MAKAKVVHSEQAATIIFYGDKARQREPPIGVIEFPGGSVEVSRCDDGTYWAHIGVEKGAAVTDGRVDYAHGAERPVTDFPEHEKVCHVALRIRGGEERP